MPKILPSKKLDTAKIPAPLPEDFVKTMQASLQSTREQHMVRGIEELEKLDSITALVDALVFKALEAGASDIHVDPQGEILLIRFRIDGVLHDVLSLKKAFQPLVTTRIKVLAGLRTDEHLVPQDGRFGMEDDDGNKVEIRVSIIPTFYGENAVLRLLVGGTHVIQLEDLGLSARDLALVHRYIYKPYGMILATGPTGSGKTTTLYSVLRILNTREVSIVTIEDPIEYAVDGITQLQVNPQTGFTFASGLRSIVRQDPNIVMVGEIRDQETAGIAVNAAMTGHLLLSTLHTIDAATTLPRLLDMGIEPFLIASTVNILIGQRLVRKLCVDCRVSATLSAEERMALSGSISEERLRSLKQVWRPGGCDHCAHSGYTKRIGIYEVLEMSEKIRPLVMRRANAEEIRTVAREEGMTTMFDDGLQKVMTGMTSLAELIRVIKD
ncbi:MAG: GspE/PulE family protein [Candidatus Uhrbacteria bacterium]|nr:GspE/PulE family protein [Candidatus Uhrbacteria bacterium]